MLASVASCTLTKVLTMLGEHTLQELGMLRTDVSTEVSAAVAGSISSGAVSTSDSLVVSTTADSLVKHNKTWHHVLTLTQGSTPVISPSILDNLRRAIPERQEIPNTLDEFISDLVSERKFAPSTDKAVDALLRTSRLLVASHTTSRNNSAGTTLPEQSYSLPEQLLALATVLDRGSFVETVKRYPSLREGWKFSDSFEDGEQEPEKPEKRGPSQKTTYRPDWLAPAQPNFESVLFQKVPAFLTSTSTSEVDRAALPMVPYWAETDHYAALWHDHYSGKDGGRDVARKMESALNHDKDGVVAKLGALVGSARTLWRTTDAAPSKEEATRPVDVPESTLPPFVVERLEQWRQPSVLAGENFATVSANMGDIFSKMLGARNRVRQTLNKRRVCEQDEGRLETIRLTELWTTSVLPEILLSDAPNVAMALVVRLILWIQQDRASSRAGRGANDKSLLAQLARLTESESSFDRSFVPGMEAGDEIENQKSRMRECRDMSMSERRVTRYVDCHRCEQTRLVLTDCGNWLGRLNRDADSEIRQKAGKNGLAVSDFVCPHCGFDLYRHRDRYGGDSRRGDWDNTHSWWYDQNASSVPDRTRTGELNGGWVWNDFSRPDGGQRFFPAHPLFREIASSSTGNHEEEFPAIDGGVFLTSLVKIEGVLSSRLCRNILNGVLFLNIYPCCDSMICNIG